MVKWRFSMDLKQFRIRKIQCSRTQINKLTKFPLHIFTYNENANM